MPDADRKEDGRKKPKSVGPDSLGEYALLDESLIPVRDVRLAVTMVGGVSLAIYESGVSQELFRMVYGAGIYGLIKRAMQSHAYVDVVSGTSAGGINGVCLAAALTNKSDLGTLNATWIERGGIDSLLHDPDDPNAAAEPPTTLMRGDTYYLDVIRDQFRLLVPDPDVAALSTAAVRDDERRGLVSDLPAAGNEKRGTLPSGFRLIPDPEGGPSTVEYIDLDLFVTGTYFEGQPRAFFDRRNQPIYTRDHNGVFHLKHRPGRRESHLAAPLREPRAATQAESPGSPFAATGRVRRDAMVCRLARVARTTSSLPAVFEPSAVRPEEMEDIIVLPDKGLRSVNWLFDGGALNNRPLDLVLEEIYQRPKVREVSRKILFVEPVPDELARLRGDAPPERPDALRSLLFFGVVPMNQSLTRALESLDGFNHRVRRLRRVLDEARAQAFAGGNPVPKIADGETALWQRISLEVLGEQLAGAWRTAARLDGYDALDTVSGDGTGRRFDTESRIRWAAAAGAISTAVREEMRGNCAGLRRAIAPPGPYPRGTFWLEEIDLPGLRRQTERARFEAAQFLFSREGTLDKSNRAAGLPHATYLWTQERLRDLDQIHDQCEIIDQNLARVIMTLFESAAYKSLFDAAMAALPDRRLTPDAAMDAMDAADDDPNNAASVRGLWRKTEEAIRLALTPEAGQAFGLPPLPATADEPPSRELTRRRQEETRALKDALEERTRRVCDWLIGKGPRPDDGSGDTIVAALYKRLYETVAGIAVLCDSHLPAWPVGMRVPFAWGRYIAATGASQAQVHRAGEWLHALDVKLFPLEHTAEVRARDPVELVHVSPRAAQAMLSIGEPNDKLSGDDLGNLSGFLKRSWRANDILWGRLDGAVTLADTLLEGARLLELVRTGGTGFADTLIGALDRYIAGGDAVGTGRPFDDPARPTPNEAAPDALGEYLLPLYARPTTGWRDKLRRLLEKGGDLTPSQAEEARVVLRDALLLRAHFEILEEEMPIALAEAIAEQAEWQATGVSYTPRVSAAAGAPEPAPASPLAEPPRPGGVSDGLFALARQLARAPGPPGDAAVAGVRTRFVRERVRALFLPSAPAAGGLVTPGGAAGERLYGYFMHDYRVGRENMARDIPPLVTARRAARSLLILLRMARGMLSPGPAASPGGQWVDRLLLAPMTLVVTAAYRFLDLLARGSRVRLATHAVAWALIVLLPLLALLTIIAEKWRAAAWAAAGLVLLLEVSVTALNGDDTRAHATITGVLAFACAVWGVFSPPEGVRIGPVLWADGPVWLLRASLVLLLAWASLFVWDLVRRGAAAAASGMKR